MENLVLNAKPREGTGKGVARKARSAGRTPGVVYRAGGEATPVSFDVSELATIFRKTADKNTLINVQLEGKGARNCLVREIQRHPVSRSVIHVDFYEVESDYPVTAEVNVSLVGRAVGTRAGGTLRLITRSVTVQCPAGKIPHVVEVDVTSLDVGQFIRVSQVASPEGVKITFTRDFNIVTVEGKRAKEDAAPAAADKK
jgi:large subunit ribosomal protein L25